MTNFYGRPPGDAKAIRNHARLSLPGHLTLTQISGGLFDTADIGTSDSQDTLTVGGVSIIDAAIPYDTSAIVTAQNAARHINAAAVFNNHDYWASIAIADADHVRIWPKDGTASVTATVTGTDTGYTPVYGDVNTTQAFAAAVRAPSGNYGADMFPGTAMYQVGFDFDNLPSLDTNWNLSTAKGVELWCYPEDQIIRAYIGYEGYVRLPSATWTVLDVLGCMEGQLRLFMQAEAATNMWYRLLVY